MWLRQRYVAGRVSTEMMVDGIVAASLAIERTRSGVKLLIKHP